VLTLAALIAGAAAAALLWWGLQPTFEQELFARTNHRGRTVPTGAGVVLALAVLAVESAATAVDVLGADIDLDSLGGRRLMVLAAVGFALLGLLDDLAGVGDSGGFRGHLRSLGAGRVTTGTVKLFGGAALAVLVVAAGTSGRSFGRLLADAALVALAANLGNLLDRAPGRVTKSTVVAFAALLLLTGAPAELAGPALAVGAGLGLLVPDLRERLMLGDAGANVLGAAVGIGVVVSCGSAARTAVLVGVAALNVASELVSFNAVIERVAPLRALDRLGRSA
jgi:UDP-GlcNAc:undecaprenyl-phosphate/decaprenyl-phosphate GlcNAc-1-phosphate transferase